MIVDLRTQDLEDTLAGPWGQALRTYTDLRDVALRTRFEAEGGVFIAEGLKVIARALAGGVAPLSILTSPKWLGQLQELPEWDGLDAVPVLVLGDAEIERISGFHVHRGALAAMRRPIARRPAAVSADARRLVLLEDVNDHANIGAILRSTAALGWDGVILNDRCADPLYRRSVKVAMGAAFDLPWARAADTADWYATLSALQADGFRILALTPAPDAVDLATLAPDPDARYALLLGSEGHGLRPATMRAADLCVRIPMHRGVDSLNVAATSALVCWALGPRQ